MIKLINDTISKEDVDGLIEWLQTYPKLTKGPKTLEFEDKWSRWLGIDHSVFCNSGSSANLLMLWALVEAGYISRDAKVVVPSLSWATDLSPVIQLGMTPLLCDSNLENLSVDLEHLETIFKESDPQVFLLVSVLGLPPDMNRVLDLCNKYGVLLLEDACESMGTKYAGQKIGTFGLMSSFSTYFGHHISTIEGGLVSTNDTRLYEILKSIRSHGWDRDASPEYSRELREKWVTSDFDSLYKFYHSGFNLRSTDLQAFIGISQIDKLDLICKKRNENFKLYNDLLGDVMPYIKYSKDISNFAYPIICNNRKDIVNSLAKNKIEARPLICGSMGSQPFYIKKYGRKILPNSEIIDRHGFYIPNHPELTEEQILKIVSIIRENK
tara:strand:- start:1010 stop:2155 length:1146 start_codon:yes stop_codon:yes gene_type:complete